MTKALTPELLSRNALIWVKDTSINEISVGETCHFVFRLNK